MKAMQNAAMNELTNLFRRAAGCISCPGQAPTCKGHQCPNGQTCSISVQTCNQCAAVSCITLMSGSSGSATQNQNQPSKGGAPVGAIVGGVAGLLVICVAVAFFMVRKKKKRQAAEYEASVAAWAVEKENSGYGNLRDARASTHTVGSIASTVLTRASNVIQIAYIPGVTNRSQPNSPGYAIPPVPPIPGNNITSLHPHDQQFFSADDILRQSVWSTRSDASIDPRASVATTVYRSNAVVSPLAATAVRAKAAVVTVKTSPAPSSGSSSPRATPDSTPPVPSIDFSKFPAPRKGTGDLLSPTDAERPPLSPAFSVGSTFLNKMSMSARPDDKTDSRSSRISSKSTSEDPSPFSDRASIDNDTIAPLRTFPNSQGRSSPARFLDGDIRMSFRPVSEVGSEVGDSPLSQDGRGRSPFDDEHRVDRK